MIALRTGSGMSISSATVFQRWRVEFIVSSLSVIPTSSRRKSLAAAWNVAPRLRSFLPGVRLL